MNHQTLLCLKGHPGTGKSTLAKALSRRLGWALLDKDDIKDHTWSLAAGNELSYAILWQMVETQLKNGLSVVVDSPLARPHLYDKVKAIANRHKVQLLIVQTQIDPVIWRQRLEQRGLNPSQHKPNNWDELAKQLAIYADAYNYPMAPEHLLVVDTGQVMAKLIDSVVNRIRG